MDRIILHNTCGKDNVERASLTFIVANTALNSGQNVTVVLTIEGVRVAVKEYTKGLTSDGMSPLSDLITQFVENKGQIWVCGACAKPRNITDADLISGAEIVGAATIVEALANGARTLSW